MEVIEKEKPSSPRDINISIKRKQSLQARYVYGFIFLASNLFAWVVRDYGHVLLSKINYVETCRNEDNCFHAEGVLRVSFGCSRNVKNFNDCMGDGSQPIFLFSLFGCNSWHSKWWPLKFTLWVIFMVAPILIPLPFIRIYGELAHFGAGLFLVLQLISMIQFLSWCNNYFLEESVSMLRYFFGLFLSTIFYVGSICGITSMYIIYARGPSCALNIFFITWTAVLVKVMMIVSLHSKVGTGLLSSAIMGSYVIFLCWLAIRSEPTVEWHSPQRQFSSNGDWASVLSSLIAVCAIVLATFSTGTDSKSFQFCRDDVQSEEDIPYKYAFFHLVFSIGSMYFAMLFISWEMDHPTRKWSIDVGWASTWIRILNQWLAASIYLWTLLYPAIRRWRVNAGAGESAQQVHSRA